MSPPLEDLAEIVLRLAFGAIELGVEAAIGKNEPAGPGERPAAIDALSPEQRQRILEALLTVAFLDGRLDPEELKLVRTATVLSGSTDQMLQHAIDGVGGHPTADEIVERFAELTSALPSNEVRRHVLDAAAAILAMGGGAAAPPLVHRLAQSLGLSRSVADEVLAMSVVFARPRPT